MYRAVWPRTHEVQQIQNNSQSNREDAYRLRLLLPPLSEQRRIAEVLDRAEALRAKRRAALAQLDTLTQSIFLDLFGDPGTNPKGWQRAKLGDAVFSASDGPHVSPTYSADGIPFISTRHVREGEITWEDLKFISREDAEIHWRKCKPEVGDVLYTKGGTTGLAVAVETNKPFALWVHVALLKPNSAKVDSIWLESMLNTRFCYRQSQELTHGIANRDLGLTRMVKIDMFLPPLTLQQEFARRVASLKKIRTVYRASLVEMDALLCFLSAPGLPGRALVMHGRFQDSWQFMWPEIWLRLEETNETPLEIYNDLYVELVKAYRKAPSGREFDTVANDATLARRALETASAADLRGRGFYSTFPGECLRRLSGDGTSRLAKGLPRIGGEFSGIAKSPVRVSKAVSNKAKPSGCIFRAHERCHGWHAG